MDIDRKHGGYWVSSEGTICRASGTVGQLIDPSHVSALNHVFTSYGTLCDFVASPQDYFGQLMETAVDVWAGRKAKEMPDIVGRWGDYLPEDAYDEEATRELDEWLRVRVANDPWVATHLKLLGVHYWGDCSSSSRDETKEWLVGKLRGALEGEQGINFSDPRPCPPKASYSLWSLTPVGTTKALQHITLDLDEAQARFVSFDGDAVLLNCEETVVAVRGNYTKEIPTT